MLTWIVRKTKVIYVSCGLILSIIMPDDLAVNDVSMSACLCEIVKAQLNK